MALTGLLTALTGGDSIGLLMLAEMLLLCAVIALSQKLILSDSADYSRGVFFGRSVLWLTASVALTLGASLAFGWFAGYPGWCPFALAALMFAGLAATLVGLKFEQDADTLHLNEDLNRFKAKQ